MDNTNEVINLLIGNTCDKCESYDDHPYDGAICIWWNAVFPKERTCFDFCKNENKGRTRPATNPKIFRGFDHVIPNIGDVVTNTLKTEEWVVKKWESKSTR